MTSFDISNTISAPAYSSDFEVQADGHAALGIRMRDPHSLATAHLRFLAAQLVARSHRAAAGVAASVCFTSIDRAFILWGIASMAIFSLAQFSLLSWTTQAIIDAAITGASIALTSSLTWQIAKEEDLRWVVFLWAILMTGGMALTAYGIFCGVGTLLLNLCSMWLGLCTLGYTVMGFKMRSFSFTSAAVAHGMGIFILDLLPSWQFLASGLVMALTLFFFSIVPWDMRTVPATGEPC